MKLFLSGDEAIARGAYEYGATFAAAYPGTPSTEVVENLIPYKEIYAEWSTNEKVALEVGLGASLAGARVIVAMKHVGVNVAADPLFTAAYTGVNGGLILVSADDPSMHSSQNEQDNRNVAPFAKIPMLEPSDSQEAKDLVGVGFKISEEMDTPVLMRITTRIAHGKGLVECGQRQEVPLREYKKQSAKYCMVPAFARPRREAVEERTARLKEFSETFPYNRIEWGPKDVGIITSGISYQYAKEVFGASVSYLKLTLTWPLPEKLIREFASQVKKVYVIEELDPYLETQIKALGIDVIGKDVIPNMFELSAEILRERILGEEPAKDNALDVAIPPRPPVLCAGCPHRPVFYTLKKMKVPVMGDIGCYGLGVMPPLEAVDTTVCMGASIGMAHGFQKANAWVGQDKKAVGVLGDSTFFHSGMTGLADMVFNKGAGVVVVLDNRTTAMTGHQPHPGTGITAKGEVSEPIQIEDVARSMGITDVAVVDSYDLAAVENAIRHALDFNGPSVVICKRACALLKGLPKMPPLTIDQDKCTKCHTCLRTGCPALVHHPDKSVTIDPNACTGCTVCAQVCRFDAIGKVGGEVRG
ncbi:MAG: indolepyruvate ferredoxin oxidoreductase subunit alpha [Firmicutes bacterium]|nr:indolepyruvate ferredoxin oxidoreductase subunit alpha [Bacillota bacterium]